MTQSNMSHNPSSHKTILTQEAPTSREHMNIVIVGHVDHGKSTLIGRLLADTGSLPQGKLAAVKKMCERNERPFEYAFLLDALKDEQAQGITIDTARCFFKTKRRDYIIIDAPGHIEFLKNMVSGAARAQAAVLVIDVHEGVQENSRRHGYLLSFLGIRNIVVALNKMDLVNYDQNVYQKIRDEFDAFLKTIRVTPHHYLPISAREGDNIARKSKRMPWYEGPTLLETLDAFQPAEPAHDKPFRFPLQDIYKFTAAGDERRIFAGRIETGSIRVGDEVVFWPSGKESRIKTIESFPPKPKELAFAGQSTGFTLHTQIYVRSGEIMTKKGEPQPHCSNKLKVNLFWMGKRPMVPNKTYKLKLTTQKVPVVLSEILHVLDASELSSVSGKPYIERHDVAECVLETLKPIAFDVIHQIPETARFVIVDDYEISGGGIIVTPIYTETSHLTEIIRKRDRLWVKGGIRTDERSARFGHKPALVLLTGPVGSGKLELARKLECDLFKSGVFVYLLGIPNELFLQEGGAGDQTILRQDAIVRLGETAHVLSDAGMVLLAPVSDIDAEELKIIRRLNRPYQTLVINTGDEGMLSQNDIDLNISLLPQSLLSHYDSIFSFIKKAIARDPDFSI